MGGFAAKQRRRVERQSLQRPPSDFDDDRQRTPPFRRNNHNQQSWKSSGDTMLNRRTQQHQTRSKAKPESQQRDRRGSGNMSIATSETKKRKKDIMKPKHLKRKIESISGESTEGTSVDLKEKERLLQQLREFERKKRQRQKDNQNSPITSSVTKQGKVDKVEVNVYSTLTDDVNRKKLKDDTKDGNASTSKRFQSNPNREPLKTTSKPSAALVSMNKNLLETTILNPPLNDATTKVDALATPDSIIHKDDTSQIHSDDDDDDDQELIANQITRQRGKRLRRRGQSKDATEDTKTIQQSIDDTIVDGIVPTTTNHDLGNQSKSSVPSNSTEQIKSIDDEAQKKRRCIGRKPVTDFSVGKCFSGSVVYTKPFGIFIDIGCHSDAFCHVSELSTVFVENPIETYPIGTKLDEIRIVGVDRKKKRITVSLKKKTENLSQKEKLQNHNPSNASSNDATTIGDGDIDPDKSVVDNDKVDTKNDTIGTSIKIENGTTKKILSSDEQLKRDRKLARRAERRNNQIDR